MRNSKYCSVTFYYIEWATFLYGIHDLAPGRQLRGCLGLALRHTRRCKAWDCERVPLHYRRSERYTAEQP